MTTAGRKERQNTKLIQAFQLTSGDTVGDGNWVLCEEGAQQIGLSIVFSSFFTWMHIVSRRKMKKTTLRNMYRVRKQLHARRRFQDD
jgi:hypothetical protein